MAKTVRLNTAESVVSFLNDFSLPPHILAVLEKDPFYILEDGNLKCDLTGGTLRFDGKNVYATKAKRSNNNGVNEKIHIGGITENALVQWHESNLLDERGCAVSLDRKRRAEKEREESERYAKKLAEFKTAVSEVENALGDNFKFKAVKDWGTDKVSLYEMRLGAITMQLRPEGLLIHMAKSLPLDSTTPELIKMLKNLSDKVCENKLLSDAQDSYDD